MIFGKITRLFRERYRDRNGRPLVAKWIKSPGRMLLINPNFGTVIADLRDDQHGKYEATVFASLPEALRLSRRRSCFVVSLSAFPRIALELAYLPADSLPEAQQMLAQILGLRLT
jgi:hypothetical protein